MQNPDSYSTIMYIMGFPKGIPVTRETEQHIWSQLGQGSSPTFIRFRDANGISYSVRPSAITGFMGGQ